MHGGVNAEGITYSYGFQEVLHQVTCSAGRGDLVMILGPNGSGKTTLLKCMSGLLLSKGVIIIDTLDICSFSSIQAARTIAYVPQVHSPVFPYSVSDVVVSSRIACQGKFSPSYEDREIARTALDEVGILDLAGKPYSELSGGEVRLVMIARALAQQTPFLFLDEPTTSLDMKNRMRIMHLLKRLVSSTRTLIMSEHDPSTALRYADQVILMKSGRIVASGPPLETMTPDLLFDVFDVRVEIVSTGDISVVVSME